MNSRILLSSLLENRINQIRVVLGELGLVRDHPDVLYFDDEQKLGVEAAKKIRGHLSLKPYSAVGRVVIMESAHNLTLDAQNALLKTLEEPPESSLLLLGAETDKTFLPTVLSRCQIVISSSLSGLRAEGLNDSEGPMTPLRASIGLHRRSDRKAKSDSSPLAQNDGYSKDIEELIEASVEERFSFVEKLEERQEFLEVLIGFYRQRLALQPGVVNLKFMKVLLEAEEWSRANGNVRAILEYLMLKL